MSMSTKNHTKNELARITAKINHLKRKYPVNADFDSGHQKLQTINANKNHPNANQGRANHVIYQNSHIIQDRYLNKLKQRSVSQIKNKSNTLTLGKDGNYFADQYGRCNQSQLHFGDKSKKTTGNEPYQSQYKNAFNNKENSASFQPQFEYQKPFHEYKKQLKNLKKQILSSLDFQNFNLSNQKVQGKNSILTISQNNELTRQNDRKSGFILQNSRQRGTNKSIKMSQIGKDPEDSDFASQNYEIRQQNANLDTTNKLVSNRQQNDGQNVDYSDLRQQIQNMYQIFESLQKQNQEQFMNLHNNIDALATQNTELKSNIKAIQGKVQTFKPKSNIDGDFKTIEMLNQSVTKISKELSKQIQTLYSKLNSIQQQSQVSCKHEEEVSYKNEESAQQTKSFQMEMVLKQWRQKQSRIDTHASHFKEIEFKMYREIYDLRNQLDLINQKMNKSDYVQKALRNLIPTVNNPRQNIQETSQKSIQKVRSQIIQKVKLQIMSDRDFFDKIKDSLVDKFYGKIENYFKSSILNELEITKEDIETKIEALINAKTETLNSSLKNALEQVMLKFRSDIRQDLSQTHLSSFENLSNLIRQCQTKMTSYGLLIQNTEEDLKQISFETSKLRTDMRQFKDSIATQIQTLFMQNTNELHNLFERKQNERLMAIQNDKKNEICFQNAIQNIAQDLQGVKSSKISFFTTSQFHAEDKSLFSQENPFERMASPNINPVEQITESKPAKFLLLEDLIRNSLTFNAMNF